MKCPACGAELSDSEPQQWIIHAASHASASDLEEFAGYLKELEKGIAGFRVIMKSLKEAKGGGT